MQEGTSHKDSEDFKWKRICLKSLWDEREQVALAEIKTPKHTKSQTDNFSWPLLEITTAQKIFLY